MFRGATLVFSPLPFPSSPPLRPSAPPLPPRRGKNDVPFTKSSGFYEIKWACRPPSSFDVRKFVRFLDDCLDNSPVIDVNCRSRRARRFSRSVIERRSLFNFVDAKIARLRVFTVHGKPIATKFLSSRRILNCSLVPPRAGHVFPVTCFLPRLLQLCWNAERSTKLFHRCDINAMHLDGPGCLLGFRMCMGMCARAPARPQTLHKSSTRRAHHFTLRRQISLSPRCLL